MNKALLVVLVVVAVTSGAVVYQQTRPTEVQSGTVQVCYDGRHQGDSVVSKQVSTEKVPYWRSGRYVVKQERVVCGECQERIAREEREAAERAERQARIAELQSKVVARIGLQGNCPIVYDYELNCARAFEPTGQNETSVPPGGILHFVLSVINTSSEPITGVRFRVGTSIPGALVCWNEYKMYEPEFLAMVSSEGMALPSLKPANSPYYPRGWYAWPPGSSGRPAVVRVSDSVQPGSDIRITGYLMMDGAELETNTVTVRVMYQ